MSEMKQVGDLEINQDLKFQKKEWSFERIGWVVMLAIALLALLGLFGQGPLSNTTAKDGPVQVHYGRFEHVLGVTGLQVQVDTQSSASEELTLQVGRQWLSYYNLLGITPQPDSAELSPGYINYVFKLGPNHGPLEIKFNLQANRSGLAQGGIGVVNGPMLNITQFIYP